MVFRETGSPDDKGKSKAKWEIVHHYSPGLRSTSCLMADSMCEGSFPEMGNMFRDSVCSKNSTSKGQKSTALKIQTEEI